MRTSLLFIALFLSIAFNNFSQSITISVATQNANCSNSTNGSATVTASGCSGNYTYTWNPNVSSTNTASNLAPGTYNVTVSDKSGSGTASTDTLFQDNFDGSSKWTLNTSSGTNDAQANKWVIDDYESWDGVCGSGNLVTAGDKTLHIYCNSSYCSLIGTGAIYDAGGLLTKTTADVYSYTASNINTVGYTNINLKFAYRCYGQNNKDYGSIRYSTDGGTTWTDLTTKYQLQTNWACETVVLPAACENISNLKLAFRWRNNNDGSGKDPAFAVDDVVVLGDQPGSQSCSSASKTFTISSNSNPAIIASYNTVSGLDTICPGDTLGLTASGGVSYSWSPSSTLIYSNTQEPYSFAATTTTYTVVGTDANGCQGTDSITVFVHPAPVVPSLTQKNDTLYTQSGYANYFWYCNGKPVSNASGNYCVPTTVGNYYVKAIDKNGCSANSLVMVVSSVVSNINMIELNQTIQIFPNPNKGEFTLSIQNPITAEASAIVMVNMLGEEVYRTHLNTSQTKYTIQTKNVKPGIYALYLNDNNGKFAIQRIVIEN